MKTCPNCGRSVDDHAGFCSYCGASQPAAEPQAPPTFCPNCGERVEPGTAFCPNCGTPIARQSPPTPAPKAAKSGGKIAGIIAAVVAAAAVVVLAIVFLPKLFVSDADRFVDYQTDKVIDPALKAVQTAFDTVGEVGESKLSTDFTLTASVDNKDVNEILEDSSVVLKVDVDGESAILNAEVNVMGSKLLSGALTYDKGVLGFYLPEADDTYYTVDVMELLDNLGIEITTMDDFTMPDISGADVVALMEDYLEIVFSVVNEDNLEVEKNENVRYSYLSGKFKGTVYTFTPRAEDVEEMIEKLADHLEKDKKLKNLILEFVNSDSFAALLEEEGIDPEDVEDELDDLLEELADELRDVAEDLGEEVEDADFTWTLAMEGKTVRVVSLSWKDYWGDEMAYVYECKGDDRDGVEQVLFEESEYGQYVILENAYSRKGKTIEGELSFGDSADLTIEYEVDLGTVSELGIPYGTYTVEVPDEDVMLTFEVEKAKSGTDHTLTIELGDWYSSYYFDGELSEIQITLNTAKGTAKKPSAKHTEDITDYSARELRELFEDLAYSLSDELEDAAEDIMYEINDIMGTRYRW